MKKIKNLSFIFIVIFLFVSFNNLYANSLSPQQEQLTKTDNRMEDVFGTFYSTPDLTPSQPFDYSKGFGGGDTPDPGGNDDDGEFDPLPDPIPVGNGWYILLIFGIIFAGLKTLKKRQNMKRIFSAISVLLMGSAIPLMAQSWGSNLVTNGSFETGLTGWTLTYPATKTVDASAKVYGTSYVTIPTGETSTSHLFHPGELTANKFTTADNTVTATQYIDIPEAYIPQIQAGNVYANLSAWIGGYSTQHDAANVILSFYNGATDLGTSAQTGVATIKDRNGASTFIQRANNCIAVPPTATRMRVLISSHKEYVETEANGVVDLVSVTLNQKGSYTISFNKNGGSGTMASVNGKTYSATQLPANTFTYPFKKFMGWATSAGGRVCYNDKQLVDFTKKGATVTLYAVWGDATTPKMVLRTKWDKSRLADPSNVFVAQMWDQFLISTDGQYLYNLDRRWQGTATDKAILVYNTSNASPAAINYTNPDAAAAGLTSAYFKNKYGGDITFDETGCLWMVNANDAQNAEVALWRWNTPTTPVLKHKFVAGTYSGDGTRRFGYGLIAKWNGGNGYVLISKVESDSMLYLPLSGGNVGTPKMIAIPIQPAKDFGIVPVTTNYDSKITSNPIRSFTSYYGNTPRLSNVDGETNTFWYDGDRTPPLKFIVDPSTQTITQATFTPLRTPVMPNYSGTILGTPADSVNPMACGVMNFHFANDNYIIAGSNNHNTSSVYIKPWIGQIYLAGDISSTEIIFRPKTANIPVGGLGVSADITPYYKSTKATPARAYVDTTKTAPHRTHIYFGAFASGIVAQVMEEEVTFGLIGDAGIAHGWDPENPVVFKKISDSLYYTRITVLNDSSKERRFTIMHKNKKYPNWNEHNRLDGDRYTQWATVTKGAGVQNVSGKTIFEPSTAFSRGDVVGVVVKYKDTTDYNSYVANNSYTLYVDSMKYRLKVDVGDVTYTSNKLFGDGTFSIYAPQNTNIYLQGWLANEWVNIGEPFQYTTDSTVIKVTFTFDTETLGTPVKYEYPEGFYIRTNIATGGTTDYTNPTKNNAMTRFARAGETLDDYYWVTDIKAGTNNVKAVVANVYNPEITNWEATAKTASSASAIRFLYNTRNNQLERVQAKSGTLTAGGYAVTVDSTNHWATKVEIPDYNGNSTTLTSTGDTGLSTLSKTVPAQTGFDGAMTLGIDYDFKTDKLSNPQWVVRNDENFTVATTKTSAPNVLVRDSGQVTGTVTGSGTITIEKNYSLTTSGVTTRNHWISFPFAVNINEITGDSIYRGVQKYDLQSKYGSLWRIVYYNTALKGSTNGASAPYWTAMANTATLEAGKGYVLQFTNKVTGQPKFYYHSASNYTMNDAAQGSVTLTATTGTNANHQNWYLIGNPFFAKTKINGGPLCWVRVNSDYSNYDYYLARDYNELPTSTSFFVQYAGDVTFTTKATNAASPAPMLAAQENDGFEYYLLTLSNNSIKKRLGVILSDDGSNDYVYGRDMALMAEDTSIVRFYSINGYNLAFNNIKKQNQTVALGYYTTTAGTHTISIAQKDVPEDSRVILYDAVTDKSTDMMADNYTFTTEAGTFDSRFTLYIYKTTTGCTQAINPEWIIRQEEQNLIIENVTSGDKLQLFHISGKCVAQITADNTTACFPNLTEGMYILTANNKQTKIVIK